MVWLTKNGFFLSVMCVPLVSLEIFKSPIPLLKIYFFPAVSLGEKNNNNKFLPKIAKTTMRGIILQSLNRYFLYFTRGTNHDQNQELKGKKHHY